MDDDDQIANEDEALGDSVSEGTSSAPGPRSVMSILFPGRRAAVPDQGDMTDAERGAAIRQIDATERKIGYLGAALIAVIGLVSYVPYLENPKKPQIETITRSGKTCAAQFKAITVSGAHDCQHAFYHSRGYWALNLIGVLVAALIVVIATMLGRRSLVAFALLFSGFAVEVFTPAGILGLLFVGSGGWLVLRAWRVQRYGDPKGPARAARDAGAAKARAPAQSRKRSRKEPEPPAQKTRTANKRYTPKAPPKRKVSPPTS